jgi:sugar lactone lactonase YvrE
MDPTRARFNDGKVDCNGAFLAGTMLRPGETGPVGVLYRLNPDLSLDVLERDILLSNGPSFSPDGKTFYFADSLRFKIYAYDYGKKLTRRRLFFDANTIGSLPDGSTVDREGYLWTAMIKTSQIVRIAPDGSLDRTLNVPCKFPTSVAFGGPDLDILYVTSVATSESGRFEDPEQGGSMLAISGLSVCGLKEPQFVG